MKSSGFLLYNCMHTLMIATDLSPIAIDTNTISFRSNNIIISLFLSICLFDHILCISRKLFSLTLIRIYECKNIKVNVSVWLHANFIYFFLFQNDLNTILFMPWCWQCSVATPVGQNRQWICKWSNDPKSKSENIHSSRTKNRSEEKTKMCQM